MQPLGPGHRLIAEVCSWLGWGAAAPLGALAGQLLGDEAAQAFQVLAVELNVVVPGALHPQRLHGLGAALIERQPVREVDHLILRAMDDKHRRCDLGHLLDAAGWGASGLQAPPHQGPTPAQVPRAAQRSLGESIKAVGLPGVWEGNTHARGERGVQHHRSALVAGGQVHGGHCADALPIQDDAIWTDAVPGSGTGSAATATLPSHSPPSLGSLSPILLGQF